jgi:hypothetical protein
MYTDPLMSFRRLEKAVPRGMALLQYYPLEVGSGKIKYDILPNTCSNIIKDISELINKSMTMMHVGTYAVKFYTIDKEPELLPYELISVEYNKDINNIYKELSKNHKITFKEYFPYFQFWDRHIEFIHENKVVLTIFKNYDRCTPYRKYDAGNIASFQQVLLHHLIKYYYNVNNRLDEDNVNNTVGSLIKSRNDYLKKHTKTVMDDTIFREFQINCLGKSMDGRRQYFLDMKKKKDQGRQIIYRYNPQTDFDHKLPDFSFDNTVGTKGVVKTDFGYHYMEVLKQTPRSPAYKIAYLSKVILPSSETIGVASAAAAAFASASKDVKSFNQEAVKLNKQTFPASGIKSMDYEIAGIGESRSLVRWAFEKELNAVSEPTEVGDSYYVAIITGEEKVGLASVASVKPQIEGLLRDQKKALQIKQNFKGNTIEEIASSAKTIVQPADSINFNYSMIPGIGNEPKLVGAAFNKAFLNKPSAPIVGNAGVFVISVRSQGAKAATQDLASFEADLINRTRSVIYRTNIGLKKVAKIKDNRMEVY